jgi:hypothetical protein
MYSDRDGKDSLRKKKDEKDDYRYEHYMYGVHEKVDYM